MIENRKLILPYFAPYFVYVAIASLLSNLPIEINYTIRIISVGLLIGWFWKNYLPFIGPKSPFYSIMAGIVFGFLGFLLWVGLLYPFVEPNVDNRWTVASCLLRIAAAGLLVPIFEELIMRGYVFRFTLQYQQLRAEKHTEPFQECLDNRSINTIPSASWSWTAVLISTIIFTLGHQYHEYPACIGFSFLMCFLLIYRRDILSCIVAHSVTNITLPIYAITTKNYQFW